MAAKNAVSSTSLGLTPSSVVTLVTRGAITVGSLGLSPAAVNPTMGRALRIGASVGITASILPNFKRAVVGSGSIGLSGPPVISRLYNPVAAGSVGLSFTGSLKLKYIRGAASGSIGLRFTGKTIYRFSRLTTGRLGLTASVSVSIIPAPSRGSIALVEVQDGPGGTTFGSIIPREYENLNLDKTVSSYPKPFTLLN